MHKASEYPIELYYWGMSESVNIHFSGVREVETHFSQLFKKNWHMDRGESIMLNFRNNIEEALTWLRGD